MSKAFTSKEISDLNFSMSRGNWKNTAAELSKFYKRAGGVDVLKKSNLPETLMRLRSNLVKSKNFPAEEYRELVNSIKKIHGNDVQNFGAHPEATRSSEIFHRLWSINQRICFT